MPFDFHKLKTVSLAEGEVTLSIPERWEVWPQADREGNWGCYEEEIEGEDRDTGTLWIQVDHFSVPDDSELPDMKQMAEDMAARACLERDLIESSIVPVDQGCRWYRVFDTEENGEGLRFWFSHFFLNKGPETAIISFNFVLPLARIDEPEFVELQEIMLREISSAFLDPFRLDDEEIAEDIFGPLSIVNFANQVKMMLPDSMECTPQEGSGGHNEWYCRLNAGDNYVAMLVMIDPLQVWVEDESDAGPRTQDVYQGIISNWVSKEIGQLAIINMPQGVIAYDVVEDPATESEDQERGDLKNYSCKYMHFSQGHGHSLTVLIMLPDALAAVQPFSSVLEYMDRAIRRAVFVSG